MIAKMLCIKAELISTRLLSKEDKEDMQSGLVPVDALVTHVKVWMVNGMPDYANGKFDVYVSSRENAPKFAYTKR